MITVTEEPINLTLREHQTSVPKWKYRDVVNSLHILAKDMTLEFKLQVCTPALLIEPLRMAYGHYRLGRNGFGLKDEIAIDESHVRTSPYWRVIGTLLHELLHLWQDKHGNHGRRNYHNRAFRDKALTFGLVIDERGFTQYLPPETPFTRFLDKHNISRPDITNLELPAPRPSKSKLKLYICPCGVKVRVGRSQFNAKCLDCEGTFQLKQQ